MPKRKKKSDETKQKETAERIRFLRSNEEYRAQEQERDTAHHQIARNNEEYRSQEKVRDTAHHQVARSSKEYRSVEQQRDTSHHQVARSSKEYRSVEQQRDTAHHQVARSSMEYRSVEQQRDTAHHQVARSSKEYRSVEQQRDTAHHQIARSIKEYRSVEQQRDTAHHQIQRSNQEYRSLEQTRDTAHHQVLRSNVEYRSEEQSRNTAHHQIARLNEEYRHREQKRNTLDHHSARTNIEKQPPLQSFEALTNLFNAEIREFPVYVCNCCGRLMYKNQTAMLDLSCEKFSSEFLKSVVCMPVPTNEKKLRFCHSCRNTISKGIIPRIALSNGLAFPVVPPELQDITPLEERLVALRIPFMQIRPVGFEQQSKLKGNVINVENDLETCTKVIPRHFNETMTVQVEWMRRMAHQRPWMHETIRPFKVHAAAKYLVNTELYHGVKLSNYLSPYCQDSRSNFICDEESTAHEDNNEPEDQPEDFIDGADETLIHNTMDFDKLNCIRIAPGEGKIPLSLFTDHNAEEMAFPSIYCGLKRTVISINKSGQRKLSYTDIAKSEIMRYDRRACKPTKILYSFKKSFNEKVSQCITTFLRKRRGTHGNYKAGQVRDSDFLKSIVESDEGYSVFKKLRSTPSYWAKQCKKVVSMVRQIGKCSFFITLSAAERQWNELLVVLTKVLKNKDITEEQAEQLPDDEKNALIREDPVTCMRHFDRRYQSLFKNLLKAKNGIFSPYELTDFFHRLEFQMRGSPHSHGLYWLKNAPIYIEGNEESEKECVEFIDKFITCDRTAEGELNQLIKYQLHKHSHTCRKGQPNRMDCRFNFPRPPMPYTMILTPLPKTVPAKEKQSWRAKYAKIKADLNLRGRNSQENPSFQDYLGLLNMTEDDYIIAVRSNLKRTSVFHKRKVNEAFINPYNPQLLLAWRANIDFQFVLDTYACAKYCVGYILKGDGGMSKLLRQLNRSAAIGNKEICNKLQNYAKILWSGTEISAQEAAGFLLGIKNVKSSRNDIYVDTSPPHERTHILKSLEELEKLTVDDENIYQHGLLDHYVNRPLSLSTLCLAEFASDFEFFKKNSSKPSTVEEDDEVDRITDSVETIVPDQVENYQHQLLDGSGFVRKRKGQSKIIRFRPYSKIMDPNNFWREQLMLYVPWRNEEAELINICPIQKAKSLISEITLMASKYHFSHEVTDTIITDLIHTIEDESPVDSEDDGDNEEYLDHQNEQNQLAELMLNPNQIQTNTPKTLFQQFLPPKHIDDADYLNIMRSLNNKQQKFVLNALHHLKTDKTPTYTFLSGGAGVGKSLVITALVQSILRYFGTVPGRNQEQMPVIVTAFTGKAAFNVFGMTFHCAFRLPPTQRKTLEDLDHDKRSSLCCKFAGLKLIIIDEVSMCSLKLLSFIDQRMKQITGTNLDFGGRSVLVVGHLRQLPPICGQFPFESERGREAIMNPLWNKFQLYELDEIMRQKGEADMCKALNNMSEGMMDSDDISLIKQCQISIKGQPPSDAIWLFRTNLECSKHNQKVHAGLETQGYLSVAKDNIEGKMNAMRRRQLLNDAKNLSIQNCDGLRYETYLIEKAQYFISTNIEVQDGLFNGATGLLMHIQLRDPNQPSCSADTQVERVWILFENPLIGAEKRKKYNDINHGILPRGVNEAWTPIEPITRKLSKMYSDNLKVVRKQFPLVACNGMTVAKSQGSTLPVVTVSVQEGKLTRSQLYVACSRATSLSGLYIDGEFTAPDPPGDPDIVGDEMDRLRQNPFTLTLQFLQDIGRDKVKLYFHNVQSFPLHYLDIAADQCAMSSDIILLVEPHLLSTDTIDFPGFHVLHRLNCSSRRNSEGALILLKDPSLAKVLSSTIDFDRGNACVLVSVFACNATIFVVYKHPSYSSKKFLAALRKQLQSVTGNIIFMGDINTDIMNPNHVTSLLETFGLFSQLHQNVPTTNQGTQIDCCFANFSLQAWVYETYYSYHKPICVAFDRN